jgi:hypothetical protein
MKKILMFMMLSVIMNAGESPLTHTALSDGRFMSGITEVKVSRAKIVIMAEKGGGIYKAELFDSAFLASWGIDKADVEKSSLDRKNEADKANRIKELEKEEARKLGEQQREARKASERQDVDENSGKSTSRKDGASDIENQVIEVHVKLLTKNKKLLPLYAKFRQDLNLVTDVLVDDLEKQRLSWNDMSQHKGNPIEHRRKIIAEFDRCIQVIKKCDVFNFHGALILLDEAKKKMAENAASSAFYYANECMGHGTAIHNTLLAYRLSFDKADEHAGMDIATRERAIAACEKFYKRAWRDLITELIEAQYMDGLSRPPQK